MSDKPSLRLILTTFSEEVTASTVVRQLLEERMIACGTILPGARSLYHWKDKLEESAEFVVLLKTEANIAPSCMQRLAELHQYENPEIIQIIPETVTDAYADWVKEVLG